MRRRATKNVLQFERTARTPAEAHEAATAAYLHAKTLLGAGRAAVEIVCAPHEDSLSARQRSFFHGVILPQIAEQVSVDGQRYTPAVWKEYLRGMFLGSKWETRRMPGDKEPRAYEVRISTEDLTVGEYSDFIDKTIALAEVDWNVQFDFDPFEREGVRYTRRRKVVAA